MKHKFHPVVSLLFVLLLGVFTSGAVAQEGMMPQPSKIANVVEQVVKRCYESARAGNTDLSSVSNKLVHVSTSGNVELVFHAANPTGSSERADLETLGASVVGVMAAPPKLGLPAVGMIQAWVPYGAVAAAAALPWVVAVTPPDYGEINPHPNNAINSEGVALHKADLAHAQGITGVGVRVGVISNGVASLAQSQAQGELPAVTVLSAGSGDEGTAMLEIVHDMAPGAALFFHATGAGTMGHVTALNNLVNAGANVIAEDLAFDGEPAFERGLVATTREAVAAGGVPVHSSAGNRGDDHAARVFAVGTGGGPDGVNFAGTPPGCSKEPDNVVAIAPGGDTTFDVTLGSKTSITLQWSEPRAIFPTAGQGGFTDLNLYVMDTGLTKCLAESVAVQSNGVGDTIEQIAIDMPGTAVKIIVDVEGTSSAVAPPLLDLRWRGMQSEADATTRAGSNDPDKNYTGLAYVIGAVNAASADLESFSSAGPVNLVLTTVCPGGAPGPCTGVAGPAAQQFQGMDFLGADGVSVSGVGGFGSPFFGTSAAAPHTAACDALVRQVVGAAVAPAVTRARLASTAVDFAPPGEDSTTGAGLLDCFAALGPPKALCKNVTVPADAGKCTAAVASIDNGSFDPDGGPVILTQSPPGPYLLGSTLVQLTATDSTPLFQSCSATVTVSDVEPPMITAPADVTAECTSPSGTPVALGTATVSDICDADPTVTNDAPALFPLGVTPVTWKATDAGGNMASDTQLVTIVDTTPPQLNVSLSSTTLWPPNHKLVTVTATVEASDACDASPVVKLVSVTSNEADNDRGDGNTTNDIVIVDDFTLQLRAERLGTRNGRVYTITYESEDGSGNKTTKQALLTVPKSQSN